MSLQSQNVSLSRDAAEVRDVFSIGLTWNARQLSLNSYCNRVSDRM
jgi:hypothetical protein